MYVQLIGMFEVRDRDGRDRTPRGSKARALLALLARTPGHSRPRRWLELRLWSDRGQEQASGSLRQALTEVRKALGPLANHLVSDRDCVGLAGLVTDLMQDPASCRTLVDQGREFLEGIDVIDPAFKAWLEAERGRIAVELGDAPSAPMAADLPETSSFGLRLEALPEGISHTVARELAGAIGRLAAEYLLQDRDPRSGGGFGFGRLPMGLDLQVEGAWSEDRAHLKVRLTEKGGNAALWTQRIVATRTEASGSLTGDAAAIEIEVTEAALM